MKVKVCGMTEFNQIQSLEALKVDFAGMIFYRQSSRYADPQLSMHKADIRELRIKKVGVFVNADAAEIEQKMKDYGLDYVQLHGDETPKFCEEVKRFASVIKAIRVYNKIELPVLLDQFSNSCDFFLFDTDSKHYGGSGKKFNWSILENVDLPLPFFLSGGIDYQDAEKLKQFNHPYLFAVDVNSRFERTPGVKEMDKVQAFVANMKESDPTPESR
jgi:phosphoribosylanthranilate isomerase